MEIRNLPAGLLGKYYAARHSHGHYRSCGVTGRYQFSKGVLDGTPDYLTQLLKSSLYRTIQRHPSLCYGLKERTQDLEAHFVQLQTIEWEDVMKFNTSILPEGQEDIALSKKLGVAHEHLFTDPEHKPAWKFFILKHDGKTPNGSTRVDISFINHHAIGDGMSGAAFHKTLVGFLDQAITETDLRVSWPYHVPIELSSLSYIEQACPFPPEPETIPAEIGIISNEPPFDAWTAAPPTIENFISRVHIITIPASQVSNILAHCRHRKATLTSLLHSFIIIHLSNTVQTAHGFRAVTPYSMRRFSGISDNEIANHISCITTEWKEPLISSSRSFPEGSKEEEELISRVTKQYQAEITSELAGVPERGPSALVEIFKIKDFDKFCKDGMKGERRYTYEISNVGAVTVPERPEGKGGVELEKLVFTQCGMVAGPAIGCSVISVKGKALVVSLHWQEGIVEDELIIELARYLERRLLGL